MTVKKVKAVSRDEIIEYVNELFAGRMIHDYSYNGLQFEGAEKVSKLAAGVDGTIEFFEEAHKCGAQMAFVHHGIFWKGGEWTKLDRINKKIFMSLYNNDLNLFAMHLPLDGHPDFGNNAMLAKVIGGKVIAPFGSGRGDDIGCIAELPKAVSLEKFIELVEEKIGQVSVSMEFGKPKVKTVGICSGGGASCLNSPAIYDGSVDVLLTGEAIHQHVAACRDREVNLIAAGHYNTEVFGVRELCRIVAEHFNLEYEFIDLPTGL